LNPIALRRPLWLAAALLVAATATAGQVTDRVWLKGGKDPQVTQITKESLDGITAGNIVFPITGIVRIQYGDAPFAFREAEQHRDQGRYDEAIRLYETALKDQVCKRPWWLHPNCKYKIALCHLEADELDDAEKTFRSVISEHAESRWVLDAMLGLGRVQFDRKKYANAITQFDELAQLAARKNLEEWQLRASLWKARALREDKRTDDALSLIQKIVKAPQGSRYQDIVTAARTEEAVIYMAQGKYKEAVDLLQKLIQDVAAAVAEEVNEGGDTRAQRIEAVCFNTLGHCYLQQGNKKADAKDKEGLYYEALLSFLWNVVLYQRLPAEHAEALYYAAECFDKLDQRTRATELRNELVQRYPDSTFARKIRPETKAAGK
jgi:tetratricopeptide (TPR) repeat protein